MKKILCIILFPMLVFSQGYTSYFTGNTTNIATVTTSGICLMGGASESDNAMKWLLEKANGGDIVVVRSSGSNGYNNYLYSTLGITVNSVETLVITSIAGAINPYVLNKIANAEMIWFAGGDQYNYVSYFKDNAFEDIINNHINVKNAPIGGTSAGMAILGGKYFSAENGSVTSAQALANPFDSLVTIGSNDFVNISILQNTITDTHFDNPDRKGRLMAFMARNAINNGTRSFGIAANEYVAVCIDETGKAIVFGDYPNYQEFAYFAQANCQTNFMPENCISNTNLTWNIGGDAVKVYKVPGTINGVNFFQLTDWQTGSGGIWENWSVNSGIFSSITSSALNCVLKTNDFTAADFSIIPSPFVAELIISNLKNATIKITDVYGKIIFNDHCTDEIKFDTNNFSAGIYFISILQDGKTTTKKVIKKIF